MTEKIGFIGLGIMGKPMARHLVNAGYQVVIHNRGRGVVDELTGESNAFQAATSPREVAERTNTIITMLPDSPDVQTVVFGENGVLGAIQPGTLLIDMSTIAPETSIAVRDALVEQGASAVDAPVSGGEKGAVDATLSIMVGGSAADFERAMPYFQVMGKTIVHVGDAGAGQTVKACNQIVVAMHYAAASEALVLGAKAGVDPNKIIQVLSGGLAMSRILEMKGPGMVQHQFAPGFRVDLQRKDLAIAMATARERGVALPVAGLVTQLYESLAASGKGDQDHSSLLSLIEGLASHEIG